MTNLDYQPATAPENASQKRVGFYLWGGPGTVRITHVKYFNPRIDHDSMMNCYEYDYLARVKDLFGITDCWVTYSWGFSDATEAEDRRFILDRLDNFKQLGIRTHAYIQGPNLVYREFPHNDSWWARDERGRYITYYRGRWVCSIHSPEYVDYVIDKIKDTYGKGFDGIYVDNIQHGQLGMPTYDSERLPVVFCGDASTYARAAFRAETGEDIPTDFEADPDLTREYLDFRIRSNTAFIKRLSDATREGGMEFGTNFYDPKFDPKHIYGIDLDKTAALQDYVLFENHSLPTSDGKRHNQYVEDLIEKHYADKDVFVVSYHHGIGMAPQFTQEQIDNIYSEAAKANFSLCLKGGEFTTRGVWHNLYLDDLQRPATNKTLPRLALNHDVDAIRAIMEVKALRELVKRYYNPMTRLAFEWAIFRIVLKLAYDVAIK